MLRLPRGPSRRRNAGATPDRTQRVRDRDADGGIPLRPATGHRHGQDRQGILRRRGPGHCGLVCGAALRPTMRQAGATRRDVLKRAAALGASAALLSRPAIAQATPHVVVIGAGFAGATVARTLKRLDPTVAVTLVESSRVFTACPFSNGVIAGLRDLSAQQFNFEKIVSDGIV